ncbi:hypothetical protein J5D26_03650 [Helicobacter pylori]|nr:hypothetical protein J5D26_03650 [Helicobacter pylori]
MLENMQDIPLQSSHEAGVDALWLEFLNGFVSFIKSIYECQKKGKDHNEALKHTAIATLKGGALSYGSAFASSSLGGLMQSSTNRIIQSFGNGSVPTMIVGVGVVNCKVLVDYFRGKIDRVECLEKLGKENTTFLSSIAMGSIGQLAIPIPVVGALIGGFVGGVMSKVFYDVSLTIFKEAKLARQRRIEIEKECRESIRQLEMYQNQFNEVFERYFHGTIKFFNESFDELERVLCAGDADLAIAVNNKIQEGMGQELLFDNKQECWEFITSRKEGWNFITSRGKTEIYKEKSMDKNRDDHAIMANVIKSLERGGSFSSSDRAKFAQAVRTHGIEDSVIEEIIDIGQTLSLIYRHEDLIDASDLPREQKKAVRTELQKSIDENLEVLKKIINI